MHIIFFIILNAILANTGEPIQSSANNNEPVNKIYKNDSNKDKMNAVEPKPGLLPNEPSKNPSDSKHDHSKVKHNDSKHVDAHKPSEKPLPSPLPKDEEAPSINTDEAMNDKKIKPGSPSSPAGDSIDNTDIDSDDKPIPEKISNSGAGADNERKLFKECNIYRKNRGKSILRRNKALDKAAKMQADYCAMIKKITLIQENSKNKKMPEDRIKLCGYNPIKTGEIRTAFHNNSPRLALKELQKKNKQQSILLDSYTDIGLGTAKDENDKIYWFCCFGTTDEKDLTPEDKTYAEQQEEISHIGDDWEEKYKESKDKWEITKKENAEKERIKAEKEKAEQRARDKLYWERYNQDNHGGLGWWD